jgi:ubiquinone/menaquinone biosynthesis C-methylase UbiE
MSLGATAPTALRAEPDVFEALLPLDGARILELGCGRAEFTRRIARTGRDRRVLALEVDVVQHALNAATGDLPNVEFRLGGAEAIPAPDASFDVALMFKSLHHVPVALMPRSLEEIRRRSTRSGPRSAPAASNSSARPSSTRRCASRILRTSRRR